MTASLPRRDIVSAANVTKLIKEYILHGMVRYLASPPPALRSDSLPSYKHDGS